MSIRGPLSSGRNMRELNDVLEAYNSCQRAKSLFFWLLLLFLVVQAAAFLVVDLDKTRWAIPPASAEDQSDVIWYEAVPEDRADLVRFAGIFVDASEEDMNSEGSGGTLEMPEVVTPSPDAETDVTEPEPEEGLPEHGYELPSESAVRQAEALRGLVHVGLTTSKYLLTFSVVMYSLCLFIALQLVLMGHLGGAAESTKAFLVSLLLVVIVVPWTRMICGWAPGVMFNLAELEDAYRAKVLENGDILPLVKYYGRFVGFWLLALLLTLVAQARSSQAERRIRARLETMEQPLATPTETE